MPLLAILGLFFFAGTASAEDLGDSLRGGTGAAVKSKARLLELQRKRRDERSRDEFHQHFEADHWFFVESPTHKFKLVYSIKENFNTKELSAKVDHSSGTRKDYFTLTLKLEGGKRRGHFANVGGYFCDDSKASNKCGFFCEDDETDEQCIKGILTWQIDFELNHDRLLEPDSSESEQRRKMLDDILIELQKSYAHKFPLGKGSTHNSQPEKDSTQKH